MAKQTFTTGQVLTAAQMSSLQQTAMGGGTPSTKTTSYVLVAADAGTVIQMNAAGATTITVNTALFSAGDSVQIQNIGAGTMTITAGTATVNSAGSLAVTQYDGGFLYFSSASSALWFDYTQPGTTSPLTTKGDVYGFSTVDARIPIGANNTVLTADSAQALGLKWAAPAAATFVGCSLYKDTTNQSIANNVDTVITFNAEEFDTDTFHDNTTNNSRITIPTGKGGKYLIIGTTSFAANTTGNRSIVFRLNGSTTIIAGHQHAPTPSFSYRGTLTAIYSFTAGDYIELLAGQISGGNLDVNAGSNGTRFGVVYLGA